MELKMSDVETKIKHSKRRHKTIAHDIYEQKNGIKHSHHSDNPRKTVKEVTVQEKKFSEVKE
jgi:hypothetical protein